MAESDAELDDELVPGPDDATDDDTDVNPEDDLGPDDVELDAADEDLDEPLDPPPPRQRQQPTRGNRHFGELRRENRELRDQLNQVRGSVDAMTRFNPNAEAQRRAEEERVAQMSDSERFDYYRRQDNDRYQRDRAVDRFWSDDRFDKQSWETACLYNKAYADVAEEVERRLAEMHRTGNRVDRKVLAHVVLGERSAGKVVREGTKARQRTNEELQRQTGRRPRSVGSDVGAERTSRGSRRNETAEERLSRLDVRF